MSSALTGAVLGAGVAVGAGLVLSRAWSLRRVSLESRVVPWLRDAPSHGVRVTLVRPAVGTTSGDGVVGGVFGPALRRAAAGVEAVLGGAVGVERRLERAGSPLDLHGFRIEQVQWGLVGLALAAAWQTLGLLSGGGSIVTGLIVCIGGFVIGVLLRERRLAAAADDRDRAVLAEFPVIAELLALAVASGEGPVAALDRVVRRSHGALSEDLARVLAQIRTGTPVARAFEEMSAHSAVPAVAQFAQGVAVAVDRGTPLADVLHAQAADVRDAGRRTLIESAARREIFMLAPVVFLVLPVTVLFAFYPGLVGLRLAAP
jgi:tight adherence protein C